MIYIYIQGATLTCVRALKVVGRLKFRSETEEVGDVGDLPGRDLTCTSTSRDEMRSFRRIKKKKKCVTLIRNVCWHLLRNFTGRIETIGSFGRTSGKLKMASPQ